MSLYQEWIEAKSTESQATERRRAIEDELIASFGIPESLDGTENRQDQGYKIKIIGRINRKVNADELQAIAHEHGLGDYLTSLFRWKPEINAAAWKATDRSITDVLSQAVTAQPGRPSFTIERMEE